MKKNVANKKELKDIYSGTIYADEKVLKTAPRNSEGTVEFFTLGKAVTDDKLEKEYASRGLSPADLYTVAAWEEENQQDTRKFLATHWKDSEGKWCHATFGRWDGEHNVRVSRGGSGWRGYWWFCGIKKFDIDLDADPFVPDGWKVEEHRKGGVFKWDASKVALYLSEPQKQRKVIEGNKLRSTLTDQKPYNANVLDYLLAHPHLIPEEWKGKYVFFWGTVYRNSCGGLCVRCLFWIGDGWRWFSRWLDDGWFDGNPAAVPALNSSPLSLGTLPDELEINGVKYKKI